MIALLVDWKYDYYSKAGIKNDLFYICTFNGQAITNNLAAFTRLIFSDCGSLPSLSLGFCVLNELYGPTVASSLSAGSITLGGVLRLSCSAIVQPYQEHRHNMLWVMELYLLLLMVMVKLNLVVLTL